MAFKDILVHLDHNSDYSAQLEASVQIADHFDAHLTGLHVHTIPGFEVYAEIITRGAIEKIEQEQQQISARLKSDFEQHTRARQSKSGFIDIQGHGPAEIIRYASSQDLVIVRQLEPGHYTDMGNNVPEQVALASGRPTLVVPYIGCRSTIGNNILVAWNSRREAVRAVHDAMPFLQQADTVKLLAVNTGESPDLFCADIGEHLARHGVNVEVQQMQNQAISIADNLLARATDFDSDMLVMGAYGHSRLREYTLGGVTRSILESMSVPVLLSH